MSATDTGAHWHDLAGRIGHYARLDAALSAAERERVASVVAGRLAPFHAHTGLRLPRALVIVNARR